jgi:hypothetical protein
MVTARIDQEQQLVSFQLDLMVPLNSAAIHEMDRAISTLSMANVVPALLIERCEQYQASYLIITQTC